MTTDIRPLRRDDLHAWYTTINRGFLSDRDPAAYVEARLPGFDFDRALAGYDGDRVVSTFRSFATELTVPGGATVAADAITNVTVLATHRRRGLLTGMMQRDLATARDRGDAVAILIASEWPIYGRYGFAPATEHAEYELDAHTARFLDEGSGTVDYCDVKEGRASCPGVFDRHRLSSPGEIARPELMWDLDFGVQPLPWFEPHKQNWVVCRSADGTVEGYAHYRVEDRWEGRVPRCVVELVELMAATPSAYARLWRFLCDIDWISKVKAPDRSLAEPLRWLLADARALRLVNASDFIWTRLLDPAAVLAARRYLTEGRIVLEVADALGHAAGRYEMEGGPDGAECRRTTESADLVLDVAALSAAYLGHFSLRELAAAGRVEGTTGALAVADAMFRGVTVPWSATWF